MSALDLELDHLLELCQSGDGRARELVLERFSPLVRALASRYIGRGEPLEDLVQVGSIGLLLAIDRFDPTRGVQFKSYAIPTVVGEIQRHFRDKAWALHVPRRLKELSVRLTRTIEAMTAELGRSPTIAELAQAVGANEDDVIDALDSANAFNTRSLSAPLGLGEGRDGEALQDMIGSDDHGYDEVEDGVLVEIGMAALSERERRIVEMRFFDGMTQSEIAARIGISQMHVSRLLRQALALMLGRLEDVTERSGP